MRPDKGQILLANKDMFIFLKESILEKANYYDSISSQVLSEQEIESLLTGHVPLEALHRVFKHYETQDELVVLKRDLSSMCYQLNNCRGKIPHNHRWESAYEYATRLAQIGEVANNLLGIDNFSKTIKCPFHEDKSPSLKIYTKTNKFICFGCGARGSPIDFVMKYKNCPFKEAVLYLSNM